MATEKINQPIAINESLAPGGQTKKRFSFRNLWTKIKPKKEKTKKGWVIMVLKISFIISVFLFLISQLLAWLIDYQGALPPEATTPTSAPPPIPTSVYATEEAVLKTEKELKNLEEELRITRFREPPLLPPQIDLDVRFDL